MADLVYVGPSMLTGEGIVAMLTHCSENRKTGDIPQLWILPEDTHPAVAVLEGKDACVCGDCPFRAGNGCYVLPHQAPARIWRGYREGRWRRADSRDLAGKTVRLGAYGDPAALPLEVIEELVRYASGVLGYTHQWRICDPRWRMYCMASVETVEQAEQAQAAGWRTFRIVPDTDMGRLRGEAVCAYDSGVQCVDCGYCDGIVSGHRGSVVVAAHGMKRNRVLELTGG